MRSRIRPLLLILSAVVAFAFFSGMLRGQIIPIRNWPLRDGHATVRRNCAFDASHFSEIKKRYNIDDQFDYFSRTVSFRRTDKVLRKSITTVSQALVDSKTVTVDTSRLDNSDLTRKDCSKPIEVDVSKSGFPSTADASGLIFGVSTTFERLSKSRSEIIGDWQYWLTNGNGASNGGKLYLVLFEASDSELQEARQFLHDAGIDGHVDRSTDRDMPVRYIKLVLHLYQQRNPQKTKWLVLCDDDTFFPSMHGLIQNLGTFDPSKQLYIGALSEDVGAVERHGSQAFGGAGVFLSMPMAKIIADSMGSCASREKVEAAGWQGDKLLRNCIYENSDARLVTLPGLWQLDFRGDPAGFYEWGQKPLSLHHYRGGGWHEARPGQFSKIAHACGEDCILQRFQTADNFIISGHSVAFYPEGVTFETSQVERTFEALWETGWNFDFVFGPQRPSLQNTAKKISWELQGSEVLSDGAILQTYLRRRNDVRWKGSGGQQLGNRDSVLELIWVSSSRAA